MHRTNDEKEKKKSKKKDKEKETRLEEPTTMLISEDRFIRIWKGYNVAKDKFERLLTKIIWGTNTADDQKHLLLLKQVVAKYCYVAITEDTLLRDKVSLDILLFKIQRLTKNNEDANITRKSIFTALPLVTSHVSSYDFALQSAVCYFLNFCLQELRNANFQNEASYFQLNEIGYKLCQEWRDNLNKLQLLFNYWFTPAMGRPLISDIRLPQKRQFIDAYEGTIKELDSIKDKIQEEYGVIDATMSIYKARAHILMYEFEKATHPTLINRQFNNPEEVKKYVKCLNETYKKHIGPAIKQLLIADPASLHEYGEEVLNLISLILKIRSATHSNINLFVELRKENPPEDLSHYLLSASLDLLNIAADTHEIYNCYNLAAVKPIPGTLAQLNLETDELHTLREATEEQRSILDNDKKKRFAIQLLSANKNAKYFGWDEKEQQHVTRVIQHLSNRNQTASSPASKPTKSDKKTRNPLLYFTRAQYFSRNKRANEAVEMYEYAFNEAAAENDTFVQLMAREGQLSCHAKATIKKVKQLHSVLYNRNRSPETVLPEQLENLLQLIQEIESDHQKLIQLNTNYNKMVNDINLGSNIEQKEWISFNREYFGELLQEIDTLLNENDNLSTTLNQELLMRQRRFIFGLGVNATKNIKDKVFMPNEITKIGEDIFRDIGIKKCLNHEGISNITKEKRAFETIGKRVRIVRDQHTLLTQQNYLNDKIKTTISPEMKQAAAELPAGIKYRYVGSCVIAEVCKKYNLKPVKPRDIDMEVVCEDPNLLIQAGFIPSTYIPNLYQKLSPKKIDIMHITASNPKRCDFTISLVSIEDGQFKDPTGAGIDDIIKGRLRILGNPTTWLYEDATRALRAMHFILRGFKPDNTLLEALKNMWVPAEHHRPHLLAKARDYLGSVDRKQYVNLLSKYGLLEKLFNIKSKNIDIALRALEDIVGLKATNQTKSHLFSHTDDSVNRKKDKDNSSDVVKALSLA